MNTVILKKKSLKSKKIFKMKEKRTLEFIELWK